MLLYLFALALQVCILIPYLIKLPEHHQDTKQLVWRLLDTVVFAAPLGLPLMLLLVGVVARSLLKRKGVLLLFPEIIKRGAAVDVVCFDKTGTLTDSTVSLCISASGQRCVMASLSMPISVSLCQVYSKSMHQCISLQ